MTLTTVTGPVDDDALGRVLVHEHVKVGFPGVELDPAGAPPRSTQLEVAAGRMTELLGLGVRTFVDPCPMEHGRDPELLRDIAARTGMQIVCSTGFYHQTDGVGLPFYWRLRWAREIADLYLHEIENGIGDTGIRPGVIKAATGTVVTPAERRALEAAGIAAVASGLGIVTHTTGAAGVPDQLAAFAAAGVPPDRCLIGHQDQQRDYPTLRSIVERGHFVGFDRIGLTRLIGDGHRADQIARLAGDGFLDRICLSQDHQCFDVHPRPPYWVEPADAATIGERMAERDRQVFGRSHTYLFTEFLPLLRARGFDDAAIETMLVANPRRLLTGSTD